MPDRKKISPSPTGAAKAEGALRPSQRLARWLEESVASLAPGSALPADQELCRQWSVGRRTVWSLYRELAQRGLVVRIPGRGTFTPPEGPASDIADSIERAKTMKPARRAADSSGSNESDGTTEIFGRTGPGGRDSLIVNLQHALAAGEFTHGQPLPQSKLLCRRFGVSSKTLTTAMRSLVSRGHVMRLGKRYWAGSPGKRIFPQSRREIWFLLPPIADFATLLGTDRRAPIYTALQAELLHRGYRVRCHPLDELEERLRARNPLPPQVSGLMLANLKKAHWEALAPGLRALRQRSGDYPHIVIEATKGLRPKGISGCHAFNAGNSSTLTARLVARYCAGHGFLSGTFFSGGSPSDRELSALLLKLQSELDYAVPGFRLEAALVGAESLNAPKEAKGASGAVPARAMLESLGQEMLDALLGKYRRWSFADWKQHLHAFGAWDEAFASFPRQGVWFFPRPRDAAVALDWLRANGLRVPEEVAIIALDEEPATTCVREITAVDPDWAGVAGLIASALLGEVLTGKSSKGFLQGWPRILERATTPAGRA